MNRLGKGFVQHGHALAEELRATEWCQRPLATAMEGQGVEQHIKPLFVEPGQGQPAGVQPVRIGHKAMNHDQGRARFAVVLPVLGAGNAVATVCLVTFTQGRVHGVERGTKLQGVGLAVFRLEVVAGHRASLDSGAHGGRAEKVLRVTAVQILAIKRHQVALFFLLAHIQAGGQRGGAGHARQPGAGQGVDAGGVIDAPARVVVGQEVVWHGVKPAWQGLPPGLGQPGKIIITIVLRPDARQFGHGLLPSLFCDVSVDAAGGRAAMTESAVGHTAKWSGAFDEADNAFQILAGFRQQRHHDRPDMEQAGSLDPFHLHSRLFGRPAYQLAV